MMSRKSAVLILPAVAALMAVAVGAGPAGAHPAPFTVTAGNAPANRSVNYTGASGAVTFKDTTTNFTFTCSSSTIAGAVRTGTSADGRVATIDGTKLVFTGCTSFAGLKFVLTGVGTWTVRASDATSGVATASITGVSLHGKTTAGPSCTFDLGSTLPARYTNANQTVSVPPSSPGSLTASNVHGSGANTYCVTSSILKQGDRVSISANWKLSASPASYNPIAIT